jgi:hypothetical protein
MTRKTNSYYAGDDIYLPIRSSKPVKFDHNDPQSLRDHADKMEAWQIGEQALQLEIAAYRRSKQSRRNELHRELANENDISMSKAAVLFAVAWDDGHSEGFNAVIDRFEQLIEIINNFNQAGENDD